MIKSKTPTPSPKLTEPLTALRLLNDDELRHVVGGAVKDAGPSAGSGGCCPSLPPRGAGGSQRLSWRWPVPPLRKAWGGHSRCEVLARRRHPSAEGPHRWISTLESGPVGP